MFGRRAIAQLGTRSAWARFSTNRQDAVNEAILGLAKRATVIDQRGMMRKDVDLGYFLKKMKLDRERLTIVKYIGAKDDGDPQLTCKVVAVTGGPPRISRLTEKTEKGPKKVKDKTIAMSWSIGRSDFDSQKTNAIKSALSKGGKAIVVFESKRHQTLTDIEMERRQMLVDKVHKVCEGLGELSKKEGTMKGQLSLHFEPLTGA